MTDENTTGDPATPAAPAAAIEQRPVDPVSTAPLGLMKPIITGDPDSQSPGGFDTELSLSLKGKVAIVANLTLPAAGGRKVIMVQTREREDAPAGYRPHRDGMLPIKPHRYPKGADLYLRWGAEADFGDLGPVVTVGRGGGHPHPVVGAVAYAVSEGADDIKIFGLKEGEKAEIEPRIAEVSGEAKVSYG